MLIQNNVSGLQGGLSLLTLKQMDTYMHPSIPRQQHVTKYSKVAFMEYHVTLCHTVVYIIAESSR